MAVLEQFRAIVSESTSQTFMRGAFAARPGSVAWTWLRDHSIEPRSIIPGDVTEISYYKAGRTDNCAYCTSLFAEGSIRCASCGAPRR